MSDRIVVVFRAVDIKRSADEADHVQALHALLHRGEMHGGSLVGWSGLTMAMAWEPTYLDDCVLLVAHVAGGGKWACGVAQGGLYPLQGRKDFAWGDAFARAEMLSSIARGGEVLLDESVAALASGELLTSGSRVASRRGERMRGRVLDARQPWRKEAVEQATRLSVPAFVGNDEDPTGLVKASSLVWMPGSLAVLTAPHGSGGTRMLAELAKFVAPAPSLFISPAGRGVEPLGALRRAFARVPAGELPAFVLDRAADFEMLVSGLGVSLDAAADLVNAFMWPKTASDRRGVILIDEAESIDPETLEACVRAVQRAEQPFALVARTVTGLPSETPLGRLPKGPDMTLTMMSPPTAQNVAAEFTQGALNERARKRWARRGAFLPLGIVEALRFSLEAGDLAWVGEHAYPRTRAAGKGRPEEAAHWIAKRAEGLSPAARLILTTVALFGGSARTAHVDEVMQLVGKSMDRRVTVAELVRDQWVLTRGEWADLPSSTHRFVFMKQMPPSVAVALERAIADVLEREEGGLGRAEAAIHARASGDLKRAARLAGSASRAATEAGLEAAAARIAAIGQGDSLDKPKPSTLPALPPVASNQPGPPLAPARAVAPSTAGPAQIPVSQAGAVAPAAGASSTPVAPPRPAPPPARTTSTSPVPTTSDGASRDAAPSHSLSRTGSKGSIMAALERARAHGPTSSPCARLDALQLAAQGQCDEALRILRMRAREPSPPRVRAQTSLCLGVVLALNGREDEAVIEIIAALALSRAEGDASGEKACMQAIAAACDHFQASEIANGLTPSGV